jgi:phospholipase D1/2
MVLFHVAFFMKDRSMYDAMLKAIREAEHFVYIENQFFVSSTAGEEVQNLIATALLERIGKAINE